MEANEPETPPATHRATAERTSERELVVTRTINGPVHLVFEAWSRPELFMQWWVPKGAPITLLACELDVRVGGKYRLVFGINDTDQQMEFFGRYLEVTPPSVRGSVRTARIVWTNDEGDEAGAISTVTFEETGGQTRVVVHDLYPSKEALDEAIASGSTEGMPAQLDQLDTFIGALDGTA